MVHRVQLVQVDYQERLAHLERLVLVVVVLQELLVQVVHQELLDKTEINLQQPHLIIKQ
jgi:hypothetical protein